MVPICLFLPGELWILVEYCRFGNLQVYLQRHRRQFINQIDPTTGRIDVTRTARAGSPLSADTHNRYNHHHNYFSLFLRDARLHEKNQLRDILACDMSCFNCHFFSGTFSDPLRSVVTVRIACSPKTYKVDMMQVFLLLHELS